jgi:short-subunit dehydrogenase
MKEDFARRYGEWAIVTGGSSGIGEAFAHTLAERGVRPFLVARREDQLRRVISEVKLRHSVDCDGLALDLADPGFIDHLNLALAGRDVGLVIGNAAHNPAGAFADMTLETLLRIFDVNDRANLLLAQAFLPRLAARGRGGLLLVGSIEGFFGVPYSALYSASKAFILSFGEALWGEYSDKGVDVLVLAPGATDTPLLASRDLTGVKLKAMSAREVAKIGLDHLRDGPFVVPGAQNRWTSRIMRRLPRRWLVRTMGVAVKDMVARSARKEDCDGSVGH